MPTFLLMIDVILLQFKICVTITIKTYKAGIYGICIFYSNFLVESNVW